jgi:hypothetical protein
MGIMVKLPIITAHIKKLSLIEKRLHVCFGQKLFGQHIVKSTQLTPSSAVYTVL